MQHKIEFRLLNARDINLYRDIRIDCLHNFPNNFGGLLEDEIHSRELKFDKVLQQENSLSFLYGAFLKQELIGICGFTRMNRMKTNHRGEISQLYVRQEFTGKGIGKKLLTLTIEKSFSEKSLEFIELGVVNDNLNAIKIYSDVGFVEFGHYEKYFKFENKYWGFSFLVLSKEVYFEK